MNVCKCGVDWDSMLYGRKCGQCGEERPVMYAKPVSSNDIPFVESLISDRINSILGQRQEIKELYQAIDLSFTGANRDYIDLNHTVNVTSTAAPDPNIIQNALKAMEELSEQQKEHDEILKEVAQIIIAQNRPSFDGKITVYGYEVEELYQQVKHKRELKMKLIHDFKFSFHPFTRMMRPIDLAIVKVP